MVQYCRPCIITVTADGQVIVLAWLRAYNFGEGLISPEGPHHKAQVVWAGDCGGVEPGYDACLYKLCTGENHGDPKRSGNEYPMIVNYTEQCYINKKEVAGEIHPLPLLTFETEGGGGGDYRGCNEHLLGIWARDVISVENDAPEVFKKVSFKFDE